MGQRNKAYTLDQCNERDSMNEATKQGILETNAMFTHLLNEWDCGNNLIRHLYRVTCQRKEKEEIRHT